MNVEFHLCTQDGGGHIPDLPGFSRVPVVGLSFPFDNDLEEISAWPWPLAVAAGLFWGLLLPGSWPQPHCYLSKADPILPQAGPPPVGVERVGGGRAVQWWTGPENACQYSCLVHGINYCCLLKKNKTFQSIYSSLIGFILRMLQAEGWCGVMMTFLCKARSFQHPWLTDASLTHQLHMAFSLCFHVICPLCVCLCPNFPLYH